jgi:diacylglycerol kinase (ATP)
MTDGVRTEGGDVSRPFQFTGRIRSFKYAFRGVWIMIQSQHNAWIQAVATALVLGAGIFFHLTRNDWNWIILAIMAVWTAEALNTAFEFLADATNPTFHPLIGKAKDVAAGAVLIAALGSVAIGVMVFGPHVLEAIQ